MESCFDSGSARDLAVALVSGMVRIQDVAEDVLERLNALEARVATLEKEEHRNADNLHSAVENVRTADSWSGVQSYVTSESQLSR